MVIVFNVSPTFLYDTKEKYEQGVIEINPPDIEIRRERAEALAKAIGGRVFWGYDNFPHASKMDILGVVVAKDQLDKAAAMIRNNPKKFRIRKEFYSGDEMARIAEYSKKILGDGLDYMSNNEDREYYIEQYKKLYNRVWPITEERAKT